MPSHEHLSDDLIRKFGLGQIRGEISTYIDLHLTMCEACQIRLKQLSGTEFRHRPKTGIITREESVPNLEISQSIQIKTIPYIPASNIPPELLSLKQYTNIRELGKGGMGVVYLATNTRMDRDEVLKVVNKTLLERDGALDRFEREIKAAGRLNHKNIVTAYSSEQVGDMLILSMEYVPGEDLAKVVKDHGPVSVMKACYYALQTANGLQHAHERGLVHRDIKPSNLILVKSGKRLTVKILDFGLAKSTRKDSEQPELTGTGNILGTPSYMAPEQIRNSATADIPPDLYSLGCTSSAS